MNRNGSSVQIKQEYDPEVRVKDAVFHLLYRWRSILLVTVLCAAVLGGWQAFNVNRIHRQGGKTREEQRYERDLAAYQDTLAKAQKNLKKYEDLVNELYLYQDGSLRMQLDPENTWAAEKKYLVTGTAGSAADVLAVYTGAMETDHDEAALEEAFGTANAGYVNEIAQIRADSEENTFCITVYAFDPETAEKGLAYVSRKAEEAEKKAQETEPHTLQTVAEGSFRTIIADLPDEKYELNEKVLKYENKLKSVVRALYNAEEDEPLRPGSPVKRWAIAGAVLGLLAMIGICLTAFAQKGKLYRGEEISERYGIPLLGELNRSDARRPGKGLDGLIEKLEFRKHAVTDGQVYDNAAVLVQKTREAGTLLLTGTVGEDVLTAVQAELVKRLGEDTEIDIRAGFPSDGRSAEDACRAGSVLWVEKKHVSRSREIRRAAEVLEASGAKVIGVLAV